MERPIAAAVYALRALAPGHPEQLGELLKRLIEALALTEIDADRLAWALKVTSQDLMFIDEELANLLCAGFLETDEGKRFAEALKAA